MSDFVGRIAARAVGDAPVARPRVRGLFEGAPAADPVEVVDEEVVVPPARAEVAPAEPAAPRDAPVPAAQPSEAPSPPAQEAAVHAAPRSETIVQSPAPALTRELVEREQFVTTIEHADVPSASSTPPTPVPARPTAPAVPAAVAVREPAAPAPAPPVAAAQEPPPVRVHIGRLEVRANMHEPPREQPRRESVPADGLSLADYLRGKREAG